MLQINLLSPEELALLKTLISNAEHIAITCHKSPDGDSLGSALAWADYLAGEGKHPAVVSPDAFPDFLQWLPNSQTVLRYDRVKEKVEQALAEADLIFCLDINDTAREDEMQAVLDASKAHRVMIDHHLNPVMTGLDLMVSHPDLSSTSELIFRLIWQLEGFEKMSRRCAMQLYCGMMTDTGGFTYNSTHPEIYFIISQLLSKGIDKDKIYRNVYHNYSAWAMRLRGYVMYRKLNVMDDLHASYYGLTRDEMRRFHFIKGDAEGLVNEPLRIKGMKLSVSLREDTERDNLVWVSLRSVDNFPANEMAHDFFNGGGHLNASGGRLNCSMEEAERVVWKAIMAYADLLKA